MKSYFIHDGQQEQGSYSFDEVMAMKLQKSTPIWHEGLESWTTLDKLEEFKEHSAFKVPPPFIKTESSVSPAFIEEKISPKPNVIENQSKVAQEIDNNLPKKSKSKYYIAIFAFIVCAVIGLIYYRKIEDAANRQRLTLHYRNNWPQYIKVANNGYTYNKLGGIYDAKALLDNQTEYLINEANIRVDYLKTNGGVFKSEIVTVYNLLPYSQNIVSVPDSRRGTSFNVAIQSMQSNSMDFCYDEQRASNQYSSDPYYCR